MGWRSFLWEKYSWGDFNRCDKPGHSGEIEKGSDRMPKVDNRPENPDKEQWGALIVGLIIIAIVTVWSAIAWRLRVL